MSYRCVRDECGQVVVLFALLIPMFLAFAAVVMDVGNMYVHKKNLQTLVDAGAFAGATSFVGCSFQFGDPSPRTRRSGATALQYAGDTTAKPGHAEPPGPEAGMTYTWSMNSARYWDATDQPYGVGLDNTLDTDGNPLTPGDPCSSRTLDVKATDHDVTLLTNLFPFRPDAKSKARVEIDRSLEQKRDVAARRARNGSGSGRRDLCEREHRHRDRAQWLLKRRRRHPSVRWSGQRLRHGFEEALSTSRREHRRRHPRLEQTTTRCVRLAGPEADDDLQPVARAS